MEFMQMNNEQQASELFYSAWVLATQLCADSQKIEDIKKEDSEEICLKLTEAPKFSFAIDKE